LAGSAGQCDAGRTSGTPSAWITTSDRTSPLAPPRLPQSSLPGHPTRETVPSSWTAPFACGSALRSPNRSVTHELRLGAGRSIL